MPISPYLKALREKVGHARLLAPAASMTPVAEGRALLARSAETGAWQTLGGMIEPLERPADAAMRETFEEAGLVVRPTRLLGVFAGPETEIVYPNGDVVAYTVIAFAGALEDPGAAPTPDGEEIAELDWFDADALETLDILPFNRQLARLALAPDGPPHFAPATWRPEVAQD